MALRKLHSPSNWLRWPIGPAMHVSILSLLLVTAMPTMSSAAENPLSDFLDQIFRIKSVHVEAHGTLDLKMQSVSRSGDATFKYWEQGEMFRVLCETDPNLALFDDTEWGYDGEQSLGWFIKSNTIAANTSLDQQAPEAIPNPFFMPVSFLLEDEACPNCRPSIAKTIRARRTMTVPRPPKGGNELVIGNTRYPKKYTVEVVKLEGMVVPHKISWPEGDGEVVLTLGDYEWTDDILWPTAIEMRAKSPDEGISTRMTFYITTLEFNNEMTPETFKLTGNSETTWVGVTNPSSQN